MKWPITRSRLKRCDYQFYEPASDNVEHAQLHRKVLSAGKRGQAEARHGLLRKWRDFLNFAIYHKAWLK